eukprot:803543-Amphidinium_carterae.1
MQRFSEVVEAFLKSAAAVAAACPDGQESFLEIVAPEIAVGCQAVREAVGLPLVAQVVHGFMGGLLYL